jgi:RHS repeat-associated protein
VLTSDSSGSYSYDANGNTLSDASGKSYSWDFENQLTQAVVPGTGTVTFKYDPFGRRIQKSGPNFTGIFLYDGANLIETVSASGTEISSYTETQNIDEPLAEHRGSTTNYYSADGLGSITSLSSSTGTLADTYTYDSFGNLTASTGTITNPFQYTGRDYDPESGLRYYRTRYYDPSGGRFISEDMARFDGGINFYRYVGNSPTKLIDPYGLGPVNPQDMASLGGLFPGSTPLGGAGMVVPVPCSEARKLLEQNGFYSNDNWPSWNPFLFWDPIAHSGGWKFRKPDGMHIRMKYPNKPCDKTCTLDEAHNDDYNPMYDPWGHFENELLPYLANQAGVPSSANGWPVFMQ